MSHTSEIQDVADLSRSMRPAKSPSHITPMEHSTTACKSCMFDGRFFSLGPCREP